MTAWESRSVGGDEGTVSDEAPQPPPFIASSLLGQWVRAALGFSGIFLVSSYVSGRIYLATYYSHFNVALDELSLSIQEISIRSTEGLHIVALILMVFLAEEISGEHFILRSLKRSFEEPKATRLRLGSIELSEGGILLIGTLAIGLLWEIAILSKTTSVLANSSHELVASAQYPMLAVLFAAIIILTLYTLAASNYRNLIVRAMILAFVAVLLFPSIRGWLNGVTESYDTRPAQSSLVILRAHDSLGNAWVPEDGQYVGPVLRLIAQTSDWVITWDVETRTTTYFPVDRISSVTKGVSAEPARDK